MIDAAAEEIFARARAALVARTYPAEMSYGVRVSGLAGGSWKGRTYRTFERWPSGKVVARTISDEETANPTRPKGTMIGIPFLPVATEAKADRDILGVPQLAVTYTFGLAARPAPVPDVEPSAQPGAPRVIGSVTARKRNYEAHLAGEETIDGHPCRHLTLVPLGNPGTYRVRDVYVDETSDQIVRLRTDGNFGAKETGKGFWTVTFAESDGTWYLSDESSEGPVDTDAGSFDRIDVRFVDVTSDLHENLDFGLSGADDVPVLDEPAE